MAASRQGGRARARGPSNAEAQIVGEDNWRSRAARGCSAQTQTDCRRMPRLLPYRQRSDRTRGSSRLYDRGSRSRAASTKSSSTTSETTAPTRLCVRSLHVHGPERQCRCPRLERVASPAGSLDDSDGSETAYTHPHGSMGGLLERRSNYFGRVVRSRHTPLFDVRAPAYYRRHVDESAAKKRERSKIDEILSHERTTPIAER